RVSRRKLARKKASFDWLTLDSPSRHLICYFPSHLVLDSPSSARRAMKITILTHLETEDAQVQDVVADQVSPALPGAGHKVSVLGVHGDLLKLRAGLARRKPDLVFNLMETFGETQLGAVGLAGLLDLLGLPYTGGGPGEIYIQEDKALTKKLLAFDGIR